MEVGKDFGAAETGVNLGELLINQGHVDDAELLLTDALRVLRASGAALFIAQGEVQLARVRLMRGDNAAAEELGAPRPPGCSSWTRRRAPWRPRSRRRTR